mmetsp:Transcript_22380/g.35500  ORF Transcript_22380/g.35500 Transcript_22380/m.35500 type:complete len:640 (+) Transcript_22380:47-1966(+)
MEASDQPSQRATKKGKSEEEPPSSQHLQTEDQNHLRIHDCVRQLASRSPKEVLSDLQCAQCGGILFDPWTLGSGRSTCASCVTRATGEHVRPVPNRLLADIVQRCFPRSADASTQRLKGNEHFKKGEWEEAVQAYSAALELDESPAGFGNRSIAHLKLNRNTEAIEDARRAVELRPFWAKWHLRLAAALRADGKHEEALGPLLIAAALEYKAGAASLQSGSRVCIHSLQSAAHLNDRKGKCVHWYRDSGRWQVQLQDGSCIKAKPDNLEPLDNALDSATRDEISDVLKLGSSLPTLESIEFPNPPIPKRICIDVAKSLREDLDCCMCSHLLCEPSVLLCGHCMCRDCVARLLDHALMTEPMCPLCRHNLTPLLKDVNLRARQQQKLGTRFAHGGAQLTICSELGRLFSEWYPEEYSERIAEVRAPQSEWVPIFVCSLSAPFIPTPLHIFEPRYRLMMRRCVESNQRFGMCLPTEDGFADTGTMLFIDRFEQLADGRSLVGTKGVSRFTVVERGELDGYSTALIRPFEEDVEGFPESSNFHDKALVLHRGARALLNKMQAQGVDVEKIEHQMGSFPDVESPQFDAHMSFYAAMMLQMFGIDRPDLVFLQPEKERWQSLLDVCSETQLGEELKSLETMTNP